MIPGNVLKALGIALADFIASAARALYLREALEIARDTGNIKGAFFRFVNKYLTANPGDTRQAAARAYRQAVAWTNQGQAISQYPPTEPIDPELARPIKAQGDYVAEIGAFRTSVVATVTDRDTGKSSQYYFYITDIGSPTLEDLYAQAEYHLDDRLASSPLVEGKDSASDYDVTYAVVDFGRLI